RVGHVHAVVAGIAVAVAVGIGLGDVADRRTVVHEIEHGVAIGVRTGIRAGVEVRAVRSRAVLTQGGLVAGSRRAGDQVVEELPWLGHESVRGAGAGDALGHAALVVAPGVAGAVAAAVDVEGTGLHLGPGDRGASHLGKGHRGPHRRALVHGVL